MRTIGSSGGSGEGSGTEGQPAEREWWAAPAARVAGLCGSLYAAIYLVALSARPLLPPDEVRYAEIAREMLVSGDWIVPHLNGLRYFEKPVLGYWLQSISSAVFGLGPFAVRLPSALAVGIEALAIALLVRRAAGSPREAALAAAVFLTSALVYGLGVSAILDPLLSVFVTGALVAFFLAYRDSDPRRRWLRLGLVGALCGLGVLTKGFVAIAVPCVAVLPFLLWERRLGEFLGRIWVPLAAALAVVLPWAITVQLREPDYWRYFLFVEHLQRFAGESAQHPRPFWYFGPVLLIGALPWTLLVPTAIAGLRARGLDSLTRFSLCWFLGPLLLLSLSRGKLATYVLPCLAPLSIAIARGLAARLEGHSTAAFRAGAYGLAGLAVSGMALILVDQGWVAMGPIHEILSSVRWGLLLVGLGACAGLAVAAAREARVGPGLRWYTAAALPGLLVAGWLIPPRADSRIAPVPFVARHVQAAGAEPLVIADEDGLYAANLAFQSDQIQMLHRGELGYGLDYSGTQGRLLPGTNLVDLVLDPERDRSIVLVAGVGRYDALLRRLPPADAEEVDGHLGVAVFRGRRAGFATRVTEMRPRTRSGCPREGLPDGPRPIDCP